MTVIGRKIVGLGQKIGQKFSKDNMMKFGRKLEKGADTVLRDMSSVGNLANRGLTGVINITDKLRSLPGVGEYASLLGGGASQLRNVVSVGTKGVAKLEKVVRNDIAPHSAVYSNNPPNPFKMRL